MDAPDGLQRAGFGLTFEGSARVALKQDNKPFDISKIQF
jgi:hypothetical protein